MKPCKRGHTGGRYAGGACKECMALRKGRRGRKVPEDRFASVIRSARKLKRLTREELAARRAQARVEKAKADVEARRIRAEARAAARAAESNSKAPASTVVQVQAPTDLAHTPPAPAYEYHTRVNSDGRVIREVAVGRDGKPLEKPPEPAPTAAPVVELETVAEPPGEDKRPPWLRRGESRPRDKTEWLAWQRERSGKANEDTVSFGERRKAMPLPGVSGPHGIRVGLPEKLNCYVAGHVPSNWREDWL